MANLREAFIQKIKDEVAKAHGYPNILDGYWNTAMQLTYRKKKQVELYEEVINQILIQFEISALKKDSTE